MALSCFGRLEILGHLSFIGKLSEEEIAGTLMVRVDYLQGDTTKTRYFGTGSIYGIEPMTEQEAIDYQERQATPRLALPPPYDADYPDDDDFGDQEDDDDG